MEKGGRERERERAGRDNEHFLTGNWSYKFPSPVLSSQQAAAAAAAAVKGVGWLGLAVGVRTYYKLRYSYSYIAAN